MGGPSQMKADHITLVSGLFCATRHNGNSDRLRGVDDVESIPKAISREIVTATRNAQEVIEKETFVRMRQRRYLTPLKVAFLLAGEGPVNHYQPGASGNFSQHGENTPALPLSVAVSPAIIPVGGNDIGIEAMIRSGILDTPLPSSIEERITKRGKTLSFLRRLGNYLSILGNVARIHHSKLTLFAEVGVEDRKALSRYKSAGIRANLFHESDGFVVGERSIEYSLTEEACNLIRLDREGHPDPMQPTILGQVFAPRDSAPGGESRKAWSSCCTPDGNLPPLDPA